MTGKSGLGDMGKGKRSGGGTPPVIVERDEPAGMDSEFDSWFAPPPVATLSPDDPDGFGGGDGLAALDGLAPAPEAPPPSPTPAPAPVSRATPAPAAVSRATPAPAAVSRATPAPAVSIDGPPIEVPDDGAGPAEFDSWFAPAPVISLSPEEAREVELKIPPPADHLVRYEDLGALGRGGSAEVRRVRDRLIGRVTAMKLIHAELAKHPQVLARFLAEARIGSQLQHAGIPAVHDIGMTLDGRVWFTMTEVEGTRFDVAIDEVHTASKEGWAAGPSGWTLGGLVEAFCKVCEAVGYAHGRGVVHRDLKPRNVMVRPDGAPVVLDWGLARVVGVAELAVAEDLIPADRADGMHRDAGSRAGTAMYMPPEQARGDLARIDARSDVYSLGAMLYTILCGRAPHEGPSADDVVQQVARGATPAPPVARIQAQGRRLELPDGLVRLCERAMSPRIEDRPPSGSVLAAAIRTWLDRRRSAEMAARCVSSAASLREQARARLDRADVQHKRARGSLARVASWDPEDRKVAGWAREDEAAALEQQAAELAARANLELEAALCHDPGLEEVRTTLVDAYLAAHRTAEGNGEAALAERALERIRYHSRGLADLHPVRVQSASYLQGRGRLTVVTNPPGAEVLLHRYEVQNRRWVAVPLKSLGKTPLRAVSLPMGRYLLVISAEGRAEVRYPVHIERGGHWDGAAPGELEPHPIELPLLDDLGSEDQVVSAGWFRSGSRAAAGGALAPERLWCAGFVMRRHPVRVREFKGFLDDLAQRGKRVAGFELDGLDPELPMTGVDWATARLYAAWEARRTRQPWRLPAELEWEKAARGVDGRPWPWGDVFEPTWCRMVESAPSPELAPVGEHPADESPYGVRGLAGNVRDWCADDWRAEGRPVVGRWVEPPTDDDPRRPRVLRGGSWRDLSGRTRASERGWSESTRRADDVGFRLVRSLQ